MAESEDVNALKRRGRRRLVGAIALVLAAVIVLPMIFDSEPRQGPPPVSVRIPNEDDTSFTPKLAPKAPPVAADATKSKPEPAPAPSSAPAPSPVPAAEKSQPKPEPKAEPKSKPEAKPAAKPEPKAAKQETVAALKAPERPAAEVAAERARAEAALAGQQYFVAVGAYLDPSGVIGQLKQANIPHFNEPIATAKGSVTRVRAGPFSTQEAADKALAQMKSLGLKTGAVFTRP